MEPQGVTIVLVSDEVLVAVNQGEGVYGRRIPVTILVSMFERLPGLGFARQTHQIDAQLAVSFEVIRVQLDGLFVERNALLVAPVVDKRFGGHGPGPAVPGIDGQDLLAPRARLFVVQ